MKKNTFNSRIEGARKNELRARLSEYSKDGGLSARLFRVFVDMVDGWHNTETGKFFPGYAAIARKMRYSIRTAKRDLAELKRIGVISIIPPSGTRHYHLLELNLDWRTPQTGSEESKSLAERVAEHDAANPWMVSRSLARVLDVSHTAIVKARRKRGNQSGTQSGNQNSGFQDSDPLDTTSSMSPRIDIRDIVDLGNHLGNQGGNLSGFPGNHPTPLNTVNIEESASDGVPKMAPMGDTFLNSGAIQLAPYNPLNPSPLRGERVRERERAALRLRLRLRLASARRKRRNSKSFSRRIQILMAPTR